jgi:hypothetical protein
VVAGHRREILLNVKRSVFELHHQLFDWQTHHHILPIVGIMRLKVQSGDAGSRIGSLRSLGSLDLDYGCGLSVIFPSA